MRKDAQHPWRKDSRQPNGIPTLEEVRDFFETSSAYTLDSIRQGNVRHPRLLREGLDQDARHDAELYAHHQLTDAGGFVIAVDKRAE